MSNSIEKSTAFMILVGMTWPGKRVCGLNYILEFLPESAHTTYIQIFTMFDYPSILLISFAYQYMSADWYPQQILGLILSTVCLAYSVFLPESPKYLYINNKFDKAHKIIRDLQFINGALDQKPFKFDTEVASVSASTTSTEKEDPEEDRLL